MSHPDHRKLLHWQHRLRPALVPLGAAFGLAGRARVRAYESGSLARWNPPVPCVSVGNIGWGGSGKTPIVDWLAGWAAERGLRPCILTRGYRAAPPDLPFLVRADSDPAQAGDEPLMLARAHPEASVIVDPVRKRSGPYAMGCCAPLLFLLDDGFQHRAVRRDLDIVLLRPEDLGDEYNRVIPAGSWREDATALARAHVFLIKARPEAQHELAQQVGTRLGHLGKPVFFFHLEARQLLAARDGAPLKPDTQPYGLITGVGEPAQVRGTARALMDADPVGHWTFPDHHAFTPADWNRTMAAAERAGAARLVCTPKDAVKLARVADDRLAVLDVAPVFGSAAVSDVSRSADDDVEERTFPHWWAEEWALLSME